MAAAGAGAAVAAVAAGGAGGAAALRSQAPASSSAAALVVAVQISRRVHGVIPSPGLHDPAECTVASRPATADDEDRPAQDARICNDDDDLAQVHGLRMVPSRGVRVFL